MSRTWLSSIGSSWRFSLQVAVPIFAATLLILGLTAYGVLWAAEQSDDTSTARQVRMAELAIASSVTDLTHELEVVAVWDDAVIHTAGDGLDLDWINENLGIWLRTMFGHDQIYVLNADDNAVYAMVDGNQVPVEQYSLIRADVADLVTELRKLGSVLSDNGKRGSTGRAIHASELGRVGDRPASLSLMRIVPHSDNGPAPASGEETMLLGIRFLDGSLLEDLRTDRQLDGARFSTALDALPAERALPLQDKTGAQIGYLIWRPDVPGAQILQHLVPHYLLMAAGVIGIMLFLVRVLWKSSRELQTSEAHALHLAFHDVLTGYPNRAQLFERLDQDLSRLRRSADGGGSRFALLLLDLDRFKQVNDALGHQAGDELIQEFANRLALLIRKDDLIARLGGDEFAIIQRNVECESEAGVLCDHILACVRQPFSVLHGLQANIGVSIGVVLAPDAGLDRISLMRKADIALYQAKAAGRNRYDFFTNEMDETVRMRGRLETDLRAAMQGDHGLIVYYQPLMSSDGKVMTGLEALVRWRHPELGMLPPSKFLSVADECGLMVWIDEWVLDQVCRATPVLPDVPIAVNLSPAQFYTGDFFERIMAIIQRNGVSPTRIEIEITENVLLEDNDLCIDTIRRLRNAGFRIALDDFGTGYSSLSYLRRFQVDKIKIDQSFVRQIGRSNESSSLVRAIINLGQEMGLSVTAEGVETPEQLEFLARSGCQQLQGYLFSRPVLAEELPGVKELGQAV